MMQIRFGQVDKFNPYHDSRKEQVGAKHTWPGIEHQVTTITLPREGIEDILQMEASLTGDEAKKSGIGKVVAYIPLLNASTYSHLRSRLWRKPRVIIYKLKPYPSHKSPPVSMSIGPIAAHPLKKDFNPVTGTIDGIVSDPLLATPPQTANDVYLFKKEPLRRYRALVEAIQEDALKIRARWLAQQEDPELTPPDLTREVLQQMAWYNSDSRLPWDLAKHGFKSSS